jgi:hypothetical protein
MIWMTIRFRTLAIGIVAFLLLGGIWAWIRRQSVVTTSVDHLGQHPPVPEAINTMLSLRSLAILNGDVEGLRKLYDLSVSSGRWAFEHEAHRIKYLRAWAERRGLRFVETDAEGRIARSEVRAGSLWLHVVQSAGYGYVYLDDPDVVVNRFGVGTRHVIELVLRDGSWVFRRDWYIDPLDADTVIPEAMPLSATDERHPSWVTHAAASRIKPGLGAGYPAHRRSYQRIDAMEYANTYCGAAVGCGNDRRYNSDYRDYTGLGGDCTNFASQVLGDAKGGGLAEDGSWHYARKGWRGGGSTTWVKAGALARYLSYSGKANLVGRGRYQEIARPSLGHPLGLLNKVQPGDLVAYEEKGRVVHFSVFTSRDSKGLPLVNSHTADRYQVPWDLGWDGKTVFWLFHIRD